MKAPPSLTGDWRGEARDIAPANLPDGLFQEDKGGERFRDLGWKRRKGIRHTDVAKASSAITSIISFELPGGSYALAYVEGTNVRGETDVAEQDLSAGSGGFGVGGFGVSGFGT